MIGCKQIRKLIDEADRPELLPYHAVSHIASCDDCNSFTVERTRLRQVLASSARVSVPADFDAVLSRRLRERAERKPFSWLGPVGYMRLGAATAALVLAIVFVQNSGILFGPADTLPPAGTASLKLDPPPPAGATSLSKTEASPTLGGPGNIAPPSVRSSFIGVKPVRMDSRSVRTIARVPRSRRGTGDGAVVLMVGQDGEREVPMPTVSVGAQRLLYVGAGGSQTGSSARASF